MGTIGGHAVVVGGSMSGLVSAAVLSARFDRVTVIDRDTLPDDASDRRGVPQSGHAHALLISGRQVLDRVFPGLTDELIQGGAVPYDAGSDLLFHQMGALRARFSSGKLGISLTRAYLEHTVRQRVRALPNVTVRHQVSVIDLHGSPGRVCGVVLDGGEILRSDLVVDATGRSGDRTDTWLRRLECPAPDVTKLKVDVGYTTRVLRRAPGDRIGGDGGGLLYLMSAVPPHDKRAAAVFAVEGDRWMVTLGGWHRSHAPTDPEGFAEFAENLPDPHVAKLLASSEPLDGMRAHKFTYPQARRRHFERLRVLPTGYVALGDAICSFNPLYGQGMTVGAMEAVALGETLDEEGRASARMARAYYRKAAAAIATPWQMSTGSDFMYPETVGPRPPGTGLVNRYVRRLMLATHVSQESHLVLLDMQHLLARPSSIFRPGPAIRSLLAARHSPANPAD
ncbi:FAD-dependent oxidoreductase [Actinacidiphila paucisporea]|uniref:2-polyprenyl-6-methoxyphenol hydroxylase n=1 Tax=Actinacidiphila paucisporea TaxID=310782 RepID=A0A1M7G912_9ACTN|nr:FAD-dependent monooxygenase [Actinacidiphila paucisporea]SHM12872.1 2-polyprenyl-6-methoxyphenol hydroxylase [Actinacidiphila paucisporea]